MRISLKPLSVFITETMGALTNTDLMYEAFSEDLFYANIAEWVY